ncbi:hypothetical protein ACF9IK_25410 [Kitasatospora hibisci]|uniref:hypothetical protein n=1 Tax=Kitasatospora hibisci TaxID=3369522 RepID=UPI00375527F5
MSIKAKAVRIISSVALVMGSTVGFGVISAGEAHAAGYGCPGSLVWGPKDIKGEGAYSDTVVASIYGYWNGSNNCEVAVKRVFVGQKTRMQFWLYSDKDVAKTDDGYFSSYAGPLTAYNNSGGCVWEEISMWDPNGHEIAQAYWGSKHNCG